jgi:EAL domain-containing protein (putative c-di-GMP-specific phosphodiesterase class I)
VEVTESTAIEDFAHAADLIGRIRQAGFRIVLDDFGTGYSSLSCLQELPITGLKLNSSFIGRAPAILRAIIALAEELGLTVTAEGIENGQQHAQLQALGCGFGQGYLFGGPADATIAGTLIAKYASWRQVA